MVQGLGFPFSSKISFSEITKHGKTVGISRNSARSAKNSKHVKFCFIKFREMKNKQKFVIYHFAKGDHVREETGDHDEEYVNHG
jgi:hypothetical protein